MSLARFDDVHGVERFATDDAARLRFPRAGGRCVTSADRGRAPHSFLLLVSGTLRDADTPERAIVAPINLGVFRGRMSWLMSAFREARRRRPPSLQSAQSHRPGLAQADERVCSFLSRLRGRNGR